MFRPVEKNIILIGATTEKVRYINTCSFDMQVFSNRDNELDYLTSILSSPAHCYKIGMSYNCNKSNYLLKQVQAADAVIYLGGATSAEIAVIEKIRHQNKKSIGIDFTQMNIPPLDCLKKIDFLQKLIEKECEKKLASVLLANAIDRRSLFFQLPTEVNDIIASNYLNISSNKQIFVSLPPEENLNQKKLSINKYSVFP